jgi:acyl-coenzyme A thioesterase PaaI-like protein
MRMPFNTELFQAGGPFHGGAIASLLDSAVVPAVRSIREADARFATVQYWDPHRRAEYRVP